MVQAHHSEIAARHLSKSRRHRISYSRLKNHRSICSETKRTASSFRTTCLPPSDSTRSSAQVSLSPTSTHTTQTIGTPLGITATIIQALGSIGAIMIPGTTEDTAGATTMTLGTITAGTADGTEVSTTLTTITCIHTTADGTVDGVLILEESTIDRIMAEDTLS